MLCRFGMPDTPRPARKLPETNRNLVIIAIAAVVLVVLALLLTGVIPGVHSSASGGTGPSIPTYAATFTETGLPSGSTWYVVLHDQNQSSTTSVIVFQETNGTYHYTTGEIGQYNATPHSGNITVLGPASQSVVFTSGQPLGEWFAWGTPVNATGTTPTGCGVAGAPHAYCYTVETIGAINVSNFFVELRNPVGANVPWPVSVAGGYLSTPSNSQIVLVSPTKAAPVSGYNTTSRSWSNAPGYSGLVSPGFSIVIYLVGTTSVDTGLLGLELLAVGEGGYTGTVPSNSFN